MALSAAHWESLIEALDSAIGMGVKRVVHNGKEVTYQSMQDLMAARAHAVSELGKIQGTTPRARSTRAYYKRG